MNEYIAKRVVIGNTATFIPPEKRKYPEISYAWTVYVRCDDSTLINSVVFRLHDSFQNNVVEVNKPFEVSEQGWGEFSVGIRINTKFGNVSTNHQLKLYSSDKTERIDEICFRGVDDQKERSYSAEEESEYGSILSCIDSVLNKMYNK